MDGTRIRAPIAVAIVGISFLVIALALWIRETRFEPASPVAAGETSPEPVLENSADLESSSSRRNDRASFVGTEPEPIASWTPTIQGSVSGLLLDPTETPILGEWKAGVSLIDAHGNRRHSDASETARFEFRELPLGPYFLVVNPRGYLRVEEPLELVADHPDIQRDIELTPQPVIRIRVLTPDGQSWMSAWDSTSTGPRAFLVAVATMERPGERLEEIQGSANNRFGVGSFWSRGQLGEGLEEEHIGVILVHGQLPVHVSLVHYQHVLKTVLVPAGEDEATFVLSVEDLLADLATVRFRVESERTGVGLTGATAWLSWTAMMPVEKGEDGSFSAHGVAPGAYRLRVQEERHESLHLSFEAKPSVTDLGALRLGEAVHARVRVIDSDRLPRQAEFYLHVLDPESRRIVDRDDSFAYRCDRAGEHDLTQLGRKLYCLQVRPYRLPVDDRLGLPSWVAGSVLLDARGGPIVDLEIVLHRAARLVLRFDGPDPWSSTFQIHDEQDLWVEGGRFYDRSPHPIELVPGTYRVAVCDRNGSELSSRFVTLGSEPVLLELSR